MRRTSASQVVYDKILRDFLNNKFNFGDKITEPELAEKYKVSRTPLREAIKVLEQEGIITRLDNGRIRIVELTPENIDELFRVRLALENMLLELTMEKPDILKKLNKSVKKSGELFKNDEYEKAKNEVANFTNILYSGLTMDITVNLLKSYHIILNKLKYATLLSNDRINIAIAEHEELCDAIDKRDNARLREVNTKHLLSGCRAIKDIYFAADEQQ